MRRETLFLKVTLVIMALPILALCIFVVPQIAEFFAELAPDWEYLRYPFMVGLYIAALIYFTALYQTMKLLVHIDKDTAFSEASVNVLKNIKLCAILIGLLFVLFMPLLFLMGEVDDAPGIIVIGLGIIFGCMVIAVFAAVLQKLLQHAIVMKYENDLTV